jgi:hypothetical protein
MYEESFDLVTFESGWRLEVRAVRDYSWRNNTPARAGLPAGWRWVCEFRGAPQWRRISRAEVEQLIGEPLPDESAAEGRARVEAERAERLRLLADQEDR